MRVSEIWPGLLNILSKPLLTNHLSIQCISTNEGAVKFAKNKQTPYTAIGD